jgi:hypothetical protein
MWEVVRADGTVLTVDGRPGRFSRTEAGFLAWLLGARSRKIGAE